MSLCTIELLLGDGKSANGTYYRVFTACITRAVQRLVVNVGSGGVGVHSATPDVRNDGVGFLDIMTNVGNGRTWFCGKFLLGAGS